MVDEDDAGSLGFWEEVVVSPDSYDGKARRLVGGGLSTSGRDGTSSSSIGSMLVIVAGFDFRFRFLKLIVVFVKGRAGQAQVAGVCVAAIKNYSCLF